MGRIYGKGLLNWLTGLYKGSDALQYSNTNTTRKAYYVVDTRVGKATPAQNDSAGQADYESEMDSEMFNNDNDKKPTSKKKICIKCILGAAVLLCIGSLFFYNYRSEKSDVNPYRLEKPVPKEVAEPLQDSGTIQFTKFLLAESEGNLDTVMSFFSPSIVRFQKMLAPNLSQVEDYYRNKWRTAPPLSQTLKRVQKITRRTYIFAVSENRVATAGMSGDSSYEVVKRVIFNNHYKILSIKTIDTLSSR